MNVAEFLEQFADLPDGKLYTLRSSPRLNVWPVESSFFVELVEELFVDHTLSDVQRLAREGKLANDSRTRQRFVDIMREFVHYDGRSFAALLQIAERARCSPDAYFSNGVNALAGIACYLGCEDSSPIPDEALLSALERLSRSPALEHNAKNCAHFVFGRRPDLRDRYRQLLRPDG